MNIRQEEQEEQQEAPSSLRLFVVTMLSIAAIVLCGARLMKGK